MTENGSMVKDMVKEFLVTRMVIDMMVNGNTTRFTFSPTQTISETFCSVQMTAIYSPFFQRNMVMVNGIEAKDLVGYILEALLLEKGKDKG
jgi:hypothetical protein